MQLSGLQSLFCVLCSIQFIGIHAYPTLFNSQLLGFVAKDKHKRGDLGFLQAEADDADVIELEHLKRDHDDVTKDVKLQHHQLPPLKQGKINADTIEADKPLSHSESLPELERQLEEAASPVVVSTTHAAPKSADIAAAGDSQEIAQEELEHFKGTKTADANPPVIPDEDAGNGGPVSPKTAKKLLDPRDGGYSPFDMAQYIFWTGDEAGVARTVEELIEKGVITREAALKFLRDIRMGVEYLQRTYESHILPEISRNHIKKSYPPLKTSTTSTTSTTTTTEKPFRPLLQQNVAQPNSHIPQTFNGFAMLNELQKINSNDKEDQGELSDYEDYATGRAKIAEFLYTEYTLEEILYKLAKVMFTQSLADGSDKAKQELQKLTNFLEREGNLGVIPISLQKKVLHVLLTALSDTLNEHPELLPAARVNLADSYNWFPEHKYGLIN